MNILGIWKEIYIQIQLTPKIPSEYYHNFMGINLKTLHKNKSKYYACSFLFGSWMYTLHNIVIVSYHLDIVSLRYLSSYVSVYPQCLEIVHKILSSL